MAHSCIFLNLKDRMLVRLFLTISTFVLKRILRQLSPISILAQSLEWLFSS